FIERYRAAQLARNERITAWCKQELAHLNALGIADRLFTVYRAHADLSFLDLSLEPSDRPAESPIGPPKMINYSTRGLVSACTLKTGLSMWSLSDSQCRASLHLGRITQPALVVQFTGDEIIFPSDAQALYDGLASKDKHLEFMEGDHFLSSPPDRVKL